MGTGTGTGAAMGMGTGTDTAMWIDSPEFPGRIESAVGLSDYWSIGHPSASPRA
jgi:hypothetical protein